MKTKRTAGAQHPGGAGHLKAPLAVLLLLLLTAAVLAQSGDGYDLSWNTVDGGGGTFSMGGVYSLGGTAGQPDAGLLAGGSFTLAGGFWGGGAVAAQQRAVHLPVVFRSYP